MLNEKPTELTPFQHFIDALGKKDFGKIFYLLSAHKELSNITLSNGDTLLHYFAEIPDQEYIQDYLSITRLLLEQGANIHNRNRQSETFLHVAINNGNKDIVKLLLDKHADGEPSRGNTNFTWLHFASQVSKDAVKLFLDNGASIDEKEQEDGFTPLHFAVMKGDKDIVKLLLDYGANIDFVEFNNRTALHLAVMKGDKDIVKLLLDNGADIDARDKDNKTPLHFAAEKGYYDIVKLLLDNGADIDAKDDFNNTTLHYAAEKGYEDIVEYLLDNGAYARCLYPNKDIYNDDIESLLEIASNNDKIYVYFDQRYNEETHNLKRLIKRIRDEGIPINFLSNLEESTEPLMKELLSDIRKNIKSDEEIHKLIEDDLTMLLQAKFGGFVMPYSRYMDPNNSYPQIEKKHAAEIYTPKEGTPKEEEYKYLIHTPKGFFNALKKVNCADDKSREQFKYALSLLLEKHERGRAIFDTLDTLMFDSDIKQILISARKCFDNPENIAEYNENKIATLKSENEELKRKLAELEKAAKANTQENNDDRPAKRVKHETKPNTTLKNATHEQADPSKDSSLGK
jgi:ankyrin repeat protein